MIGLSEVNRERFLIFGSFLLLVVISIVYLLYSNAQLQKQGGVESNPFIPEWAPKEGKTGITENQYAILQNVKTIRVEITDNELTPQSVVLKPNDQAQFFNLTSNTDIHVAGEGWGNIVLSPGQNMTQPFVKPGEYPYEITELELTGEIIVE